ncbi:MAG TPA: hypothetical protein ENN35_09560 [Deltaproteobacteria bacterium]|nr:hypothetical protein [Deltaproteobacteria bacterium]
MNPSRTSPEWKSSDERGIVLVTVILLIAVLMALGTTAILQTSTDIRISGNYLQNRVALNNAETGVDQVITYLQSNDVSYPTSDDPSTTITVSTPAGFSFNTSVVIDYVSSDRYRFQMTGTGANNASKTLEVQFEREPLYPQGADGAVAMYGGDPAVAFKVGGGGGYNVDGHDYPIPTACPCTGGGCSTTAGATGATTGLYTVMAPDLEGDVDAHLGGSPSQTLGGGLHTDDEWKAFVNYVIEKNLYQDNTFGTRDNPAVTRVPSGSTLNGNGHYAGILIVEDGGELVLNGTFTFEGIVILRGTGQMSGSGTGNIFGSTITIDHESKLIDVTGSVNLFYSSEALANLANLNDLHVVQLKTWKDVL